MEYPVPKPRECPETPGAVYVDIQGMALYARNGRFTAQIHVQGRKYHLGYFLDPESAAQAYDAAALRYFGAYARINFPRLAKGV